MIQAIIPDLVVDLRALPECALDIAAGNLAGNRHLADLKTLAGGDQYARPGSPVEARQEEVARERSPTASPAHPKTPGGA